MRERLRDRKEEGVGELEETTTGAGALRALAREDADWTNLFTCIWAEQLAPIYWRAVFVRPDAGDGTHRVR